jgi:hypothetical protein
MPGHGRDNLQHELELGAAHACMPTPGGVTASVLAIRDEAPGPAVQTATPGWEPPFVAALRRIGLELRLPLPAQGGPAGLRDRAAVASGAADDGQVRRGVEST